MCWYMYLMGIYHEKNIFLEAYIIKLVLFVHAMMVFTILDQMNTCNIEIWHFLNR